MESMTAAHVIDQGLIHMILFCGFRLFFTALAWTYVIPLYTIDIRTWPTACGSNRPRLYTHKKQNCLPIHRFAFSGFYCCIPTHRRADLSARILLDITRFGCPLKYFSVVFGPSGKLLLVWSTHTLFKWLRKLRKMLCFIFQGNCFYHLQ